LPKPEQHSPLHMFPAPWLRLLQRLDTFATLWRRTLSHNSFSCQIPSVSSEELALPRLIRCELPRLRCHGHNLLLSSYLCKTKRENSLCSACEHPLHPAGSDSPPPWLSRIRASSAHHLRHHFFNFWPLVQTLRSGPTVGSLWSSSTPPSLGRGWVAPPPI